MATTTILVENMLCEDDFEDDDCFEESQHDILQLAKNVVLHNDENQDDDTSDKNYDLIEVQNLRIDREEGSKTKGHVYITYSGVGHEIYVTQAVDKLNSMIIGGQSISAKLLTLNATNELSTPLSTVSSLNINETSFSPTAIKGVEMDMNSTSIISESNVPVKPTSTAETLPTVTPSPPPPPMYSGSKLIPERFAICKRVPKIPNSTPTRSYATRIDNEQALPLLQNLLTELMRFQIRSKDDANARARRRIVMGLREVARGLRAKKCKMVIMANNLDEYGVIDDKLQEILDLCEEWDVPVVYELNKRKLGKALGKNIKISVVGIQNADGAQEQFKKLKKIIRISARVVMMPTAPTPPQPKKTKPPKKKAPKQKKPASAANVTSASEVASKSKNCSDPVSFAKNLVPAVAV